jgi:enamine deaminase RidA (YjgF/YER057c/UK114 family)
VLPPGLDLPPPPQPAGVYRPAVIVGEFVFLSSFGPRNPDGTPLTGMVGRDLDIDGARAAARNVGGTLISVLQDVLGDLGRIRQVVRVTGLVWATPDFTRHPTVIDGCSQMLTEVLGECGTHARAAYGVASLPFGVPVSIDCVCHIAV